MNTFSAMIIVTVKQKNHTVVQIKALGQDLFNDIATIPCVY